MREEASKEEVFRGVVQGAIPAEFGRMPHLRRLVLNNNKLSGGLDDFSAALPAHNKLQWLDIAHNQFSGTLFAPDIVKLAVFSSMRDQFQTEFDKQAIHIFDASNNQLIGEVSQEILQVPAPQPVPART